MIAKPVIIAVVIGIGAALLLPAHWSTRTPPAPVPDSGERHATLSWGQKVQLQTIEDIARRVQIAAAAGDHVAACAHTGVLSESWLSLASSLPADTIEHEQAQDTYRKVSQDYRACRGF